MKRFSYLLLLFAVLAAGCTPGGVTVEEEIATDIESTTWKLASHEAGTVEFHITTNMKWMITKESGWISFNPAEGTGDAAITMTFSTNTAPEPRTVNFSVTGIGSTDNKTLTYTLIQPGFTDGPVDEYYLRAEPRNITGISSDGIANQAITVTANVPWRATSHDTWVQLNGGEGTGDGSFAWTVMTNGGDARSSTITLICTDPSLGVPAVTITLSQNKNDGGTGEQPYGWLELPRVVEEGDNHFSALFAPLPSNSKARNYSMLYDYKEKMAYWVAYPLHPVYFIGSGRSDSWTYNPDVPNQYQADGYQSGYSKGHQIPSSDRPPKGDLRNRQTFYYTNITPQIQNEFNGGIWLKLENAVKNWAKSSGSNGNDTLYVVTGAVLQKVGGNETIKRESKNNVAIPNYYYKVLLKKKKNSTTEYTAIGFWLEHKKYDTQAAPTHSNSYTVDQIEEWTGFDFFANLPEDVQSRMESVKETSEWSIDTSSN